MAGFNDSIKSAAQQIYNSLPEGTGQFLKGQPSRVEQLSRLSPQQLTAQNQLLQNFTPEVLNNAYNFQPLADRARKRFNTETLPTIANLWTSNREGQGLGRPSRLTTGAQNEAGAELESQLASLEAQFNLQKQSHLNQLLSAGLNPSTENIFHPREPGFLEQGYPYALQAGSNYFSGNNQGQDNQGYNWTDLIGPGLGAILGGAVGGPAGAAAGAGGGAAFNPGLRWAGNKSMELFNMLLNRLRGINSSGQQALPGPQQGFQLPTFSQYLDQNVRKQ